MASPQTLSCTDGDSLLPNQPYLALHPHYGMLLGVADFMAEQAYHRGKMRLHNAWAHGWGVLWGLSVRADSADIAKGELAVAAGLALDGRGRELHNDVAQCLNVGRWFVEHRDDAGFTFTEAAGAVGFDAHVRIRHHACLTNPVPALADSCAGASASVAYSRVYETVAIELVPGLAPPASHRHHLLRVLAGLDDAAVDDDGNVLTADQHALDARATIAAAAAGPDRIQAASDALHQIAVLDTMADTTAQDPDDAEAGLFPANGPAALALADVAGIALQQQADGSYTLTAATVNNGVRSVLLPTATLQSLAGSLLAGLI